MSLSVLRLMIRRRRYVVSTKVMWGGTLLDWLLLLLLPRLLVRVDSNRRGLQHWRRLRRRLLLRWRVRRFKRLLKNGRWWLLRCSDCLRFNFWFGRICKGWRGRRVLACTRGPAFRVAAQTSGCFGGDSVFLQKFLDLTMLRANVPDEGQLSLALEVALRTFEGRRRRQTFGQFLVKMLGAVVIVEHPGVGEHLAADLTVVGLVFVELPAFSELFLHKAEDDTMRQSEVTTQI